MPTIRKDNKDLSFKWPLTKTSARRVQPGWTVYLECRYINLNTENNVKPVMVHDINNKYIQLENGAKLPFKDYNDDQEEGAWRIWLSKPTPEEQRKAYWKKYKSSTKIGEDRYAYISKQNQRNAQDGGK